MIDIVDKKDIAKRKPYRMSPKVVQKMLTAKKAKKVKLMHMADKISTLNDLAQSMADDILRQNIRNKTLIEQNCM